MPRISGVDIPDKKKILFSLQYIHGIGAHVAKIILDEAKISPDALASELSEIQLGQIAALIDATHLVEGALRRHVSQNVQRLKDIRAYRGDRHRRGLPVRGQRTQSNARTRKGKKKTVAGKKGVKAK